MSSLRCAAPMPSKARHSTGMSDDGMGRIPPLFSALTRHLVFRIARSGVRLIRTMLERDREELVGEDLGRVRQIQ